MAKPDEPVRMSDRALEFPSGWVVEVPVALWVRRVPGFATVATNGAYALVWEGGTRGAAESPRDWLEAVAAVDRERVVGTLTRWLEDGGAGDLEVVFRVGGPEGGERWVLERARRGGREYPDLVHGTSVDLTAVSKWSGGEIGATPVREEGLELIETRLDQDRFMAVLAHELRSPLAGCLAMVELLAEDVHGPLTPRQREVVESVEASGTRLLELIGEVLDLSRLAAGGRPGGSVRTWKARRLSSAAVSLVMETARRRSVRVGFEEGGSDHTLRVDGPETVGLLAEVLGWLVRGCEAGGRVDVTLEALEPGPGVRWRMWRAWYLRDGSREDGLGDRHWHRVRQRLARRGGSLRVEASPEVGVCCRVELPLLPVPGAGPVPEGG